MNPVRMWKVPFRSVLCSSFPEWVRATVWCHFVVRVFPFVHDFRSDALCSSYVNDPSFMYGQLEYVVLSSRAAQSGVPMNAAESSLERVRRAAEACANHGVRVQDVLTVAEDAWRSESVRATLES